MPFIHAQARLIKVQPESRGIMTKRSLSDLWKTYVDLVRKSHPNAVDEIEPDMAHLKSIGACPELLKAAGYQAEIDNIYWAPNKELREYAPDFFANSLTVGDDGCGNFYCWLDVRDENSSILYICHDPPMIMVVADTAADWIKAPIKISESQGFDETKESSWDQFYDAMDFNDMLRNSGNSSLYNGQNNELGLSHWQRDGLTYFDFNNARPKARVSLDYNGKHTAVVPIDKTGILALGVKDKETIKSQRRTDIISYALMAALLACCFYYFNQIANNSLVYSLFISLALMVGLIWAATALYFWFVGIWAKAKARKR